MHEQNTRVLEPCTTVLKYCFSSFSIRALHQCVTKSSFLLYWAKKVFFFCIESILLSNVWAEYPGIRSLHHCVKILFFFFKIGTQHFLAYIGSLCPILLFHMCFGIKFLNFHVFKNLTHFLIGKFQNFERMRTKDARLLTCFPTQFRHFSISKQKCSC